MRRVIQKFRIPLLKLYPTNNKINKKIIDAKNKNPPSLSDKRSQEDIFGKYIFDISFLKWTRQFIDKSLNK